MQNNEEVIGSENEVLQQQICAALMAGDFLTAETKAKNLSIMHDGRFAGLALLTSVYIESRQQEKAEKVAAELLRENPRHVYAIYLKARVEFMAGEHASVIERLTPALQRVSAKERPYKEKICNLLGQCYRFLGDSEKSTAYYRQAADAADNTALKATEYSNYLFNLHYLFLSEEKIYHSHCGYNRIFSKICPFMHRQRNCRQKIRLGYISPDFREHVVLRFVYALLEQYSTEDFEVFCYANCGEDEYSRKIAGQVDGWCNIYGLPAAEAARRIYEDHIDILMDFSGHTRNNVLPVLAYKPAPVQLSGIGYFATTGLRTVDYFLGDIYIDRAGEEAYFSERLLRLPQSHFCYTPLQSVPLTAEAPCMKKGYVTFGSFNNFTKVNDTVLAAWQEILQRVPGARLLLKADVFDHEDSKEIALQRMERRGMDLARIECRGLSSDYLPEYNEVDIALDTFPYPGGGTTCDALYMGVPVITLYGASHGSRFGYSILKNIGLEELAVDSVTGYIEAAVQLAGAGDILGLLHRQLRQMMKQSPLMDSAAYRCAIESVYKKIWQSYCAGQMNPERRELPKLRLQWKKFMAQRDWTQALAAADLMLAADTQDKADLELLAALYIDKQESAGAMQALERLQNKAGQYGYSSFLQARIYYLEERWQDALDSGKKALALGGMSRGQQSLTHNLLSKIYKDTGRQTMAAEEDYAAFSCAPDLSTKAAAYSNYLFSLHYIQKSPQFMYEAACRYGELFREIPVYSHAAHREHAKLRIGYISPDFSFHIVAFFSYVFFQQYDVNRFEVYGYANCPDNFISREFAAAATCWRNITGHSPAEAAQWIYEDEIDILVDLSGHTNNNCLPVLAYKPAPVQISGIGWFNTTGLPAVDYFLADDYTDPVGMNDGYFTEKLLRLPQSHFCYRWHDIHGECRPAPVLSNQYITFGSFNNFAKVTDEMLAAWKEILQKVPGSKLFLKTAVFDHKEGREDALRRMEEAGIDLKSVQLAGHTAEYLSAYESVDIALDTYPYPGGGTTCDALCMGVPVITLVGQRHNSRFGYSLLMNIGLAECCAFSLAEYIGKATALAANVQHLADLHRTLRWRLQQSAIMDESMYMAAIEAVYERIWQQWRGKISTAADELTLQSVYKDVQEHDWKNVTKAAAILAARDDCPADIFMANGFAWLQQNSYGRAEYWLRQALDRHIQNDIEAYLLLCETLQKRLDYAGAWQAADRAVKIMEKAQNRGTGEFQQRVWLARARIGLLLGNAAEASADYFRAYEVSVSLYERCRMYSSYLLSLHNTEIDAEELFSRHKEYQQLFAGRKALRIPVQPKKKIRIGYLSPDFRQHVMFSFYYVLFACYDAAKFEIYAYSMQPEEKEDGYTAAIRSRVSAWRNLAGLDYEDAAARIRQDQIDILVDLAGHSADSGLPILAFRAAPVQLSGLGYMNTTGLSEVDYFITDAQVNPASEPAGLLTENPLYLSSQFCYVARNDVPAPLGRVPSGKSDKVVFGVFNHYYKITDCMLQAWQNILQRLPKAELLFKSQVFASLSAVETAYWRLQKMGFDMGRVYFEPADNKYMERYLAVDIALDTYPYPGGGTTCDALYMGVPVISLYGQRRGSRFGLDFLKTVGLEELAVDSVQAYIERAVDLAEDKTLLDALHENIRTMMQHSSLMNTKAYMEELEKAYRQIYAERL